MLKIKVFFITTLISFASVRATADPTFQPSPDIEFDFTINFSSAYLSSDWQQDAFTKEITYGDIEADCDMNMHAIYKGKDDFNYIDGFMAMTLILEFKDGFVASRRVENLDALFNGPYIRGDDIGFFVGGHSTRHEAGHNVEELKKLTAYRCSSSNIKSVTLVGNPSFTRNGKIRYQSGAIISVNDVVRRSRVQIKGSVNRVATYGEFLQK
jgi:hypothetical protein